MQSGKVSSILTQLSLSALRSVPKQFDAVADALECVIRDRGVRFVAPYLGEDGVPEF